MATSRKRPTRRAVLLGAGGAGALALSNPLGTAPVAAQAKGERTLLEVVPIKGKSGPGLEQLDPGMLKIMDRHGIPGAALAVEAHPDAGVVGQPLPAV